MAISRLTKVPIEWLLNDQSDPGDVWKIGVVSGVGSQPRPTQGPATNGLAYSKHIDRAEETFWRAVEYHVSMAQPEMAACFDVPVEVLSMSMRVRFMCEKVLACFTSHTDDQSTLFYLGRLLLAERAMGNGFHKHLLVWMRDGSDLSAVVSTAQRMFAVTVHPVQTAEEAAAYLMSLE